MNTWPSDDESAPYSLLGERYVAFNSMMAREYGTEQPTPHEFGDTKHRLIDYTATSASPFREDFPNAWLAEPDKTSVTGATVQIDVPSSAKPPQPGVLYVMPTMGWTTESGADQVTVTRRGGGVRVWLRRGWNASGDGELLGVVVGYPLIAPGGDNYALVSIVGADPARRGSVPENLTPELFRNATVVSEYLTLPGAIGRVQAVAFLPTFDEQTKALGLRHRHRHGVGLSALPAAVVGAVPAEFVDRMPPLVAGRGRHRPDVARPGRDGGRHA